MSIPDIRTALSRRSLLRGTAGLGAGIARRMQRNHAK